jgi:NADH-quinone oxidoreductase subunit G
MAARGDREVLTTAPGQRLDNPYSLNTVDVCPVGALTAKDFRFSMRAWELQMVPSICTGCATGCNDEIQFSAGRIWRLYPRHNPEVNRYWMCDEGRFTYREIHERRLGTALIAGEPAPLARALEAASARLTAAQKAGASFGVVFSAQASNEDNFALARLAFDLLKVEKAYLAGRPPRPERADQILRHADMNPNSAGALLTARGRTAPQAELSADLEKGALKGLLILAEDVVLTPGAQKAAAALETLIVLACHDSELVRTAQVALPAAAWAELDGTMTNSKGMVQRLHAALPPPGDARPRWQMLAQLAQTLGHTLDWADARAVFREMVAAVNEFQGASFGRPAVPVQLRFAGSRG